ncbi:MAG: asparagine synthase [Acidobacteria bacterium OLB17]|nr:MAG: asparagine synthase [Acidobacteria bacterium OLB17]MCZ2389966.1 asparagine synthase (glutamine-hydrolyzing) [Acidobacteriota bacterium]
MCGINGIVLHEGRVDERRLTAMRDVLEHRGPDDAGIFIEGRAGLGHRRLSIVDIAGGIQPMRLGNTTIVYNGEIYDHNESRKALAEDGVAFTTTSDTETILALYERYGRDAVEHLRGMFAFAIWDADDESLFIARDRLGVKPLYYVHTEDGDLYFASEIKSLLAAEAVKPQMNFEALEDQFANHGTCGDITLFTGVKRLRPGHTLVWKDGRITIREYWDLAFEPKLSRADDRDFVEEWREMFREAVELRLMADVPLGMFLSGGIDSSAIAGVMSQLVDEPIKTFSVAFDDREANEHRFARLVADEFGTDHHETIVTPDEFFDALPKLVWHEDEPLGFIASVPLYFVSKLAAEHVKVVLTGEGSDETLAGYGRYAKALKLLEMGERYEAIAPSFIRGAVRGGVAALPPALGRKLGRTFLSRDADIENLFFDNFAVFQKRDQARLFSKDVRTRFGISGAYGTLAEMLAASDAEDTLDKLLYADTKTYLHELLMKQDQMSMAASIESRVPFLDHKLVEFSARMPREMKLRGATTKWILREAMQNLLPQEILTRPKMGFPVPLGKWLRTTHRHIVDEYVLGERAASRGIFDREYVRELAARHFAGENLDEKMWALINFEIWARTFIDGEAVK